MKRRQNLFSSFSFQLWRIPKLVQKKLFNQSKGIIKSDSLATDAQALSNKRSDRSSIPDRRMNKLLSSIKFFIHFVKAPNTNQGLFSFNKNQQHKRSKSGQFFRSNQSVLSSTVNDRELTKKANINGSNTRPEFRPSRENMTSQGRYYPKHLSLPISSDTASDSRKLRQFWVHPNPLERYQQPTAPLSRRGWLRYLAPLAAAIILMVIMVISLPHVYAEEASAGTTGIAAFDDLNKFGIPAVQYQATDTGGEYSVTIQILAIMTLLSVIPALIILMTSFTRIIVVLAILRQAIGLQQTPSNQILLGLSLFLTLFVMMPIFRMINAEAVQPYLNETITSQQALDRALVPIHEFMLGQTREDDLQLFMRISGEKDIPGPEQTPLHILIPAFITSELKTAFQIGFLIFIPFLIIDLVVASILMAMGMMMLSPIIISLPFKIMLFVLIDGWAMIMGTLANSFGTI